MPKFFMLSGSLLAALAVIMGAFGAHGLKPHLGAEMMSVYKTAVEYHVYHAFGLILIGLIANNLASNNLALWAGACMMIGVLLFSGSLYLLSITGVRWLGAITPFGGISFILGWLLLAWAIWRQV